jgi:hypothetical protein
MVRKPARCRYARVFSSEGAGAGTLTLGTGGAASDTRAVEVGDVYGARTKEYNASSTWCAAEARSR